MNKPNPVIRRMRPAALAAAGLLTVTALAGCSGAGESNDDRPRASDGGTTPADLSAQRLDWRPCEAPTVAQGGGKAPGDDWECATMKAPLDHAEPKGETIDLALIRKQATDKSKRLGSLVYNFGGPGGSGVFTLPLAAQDYKELNSRYDLVSFDPRGVGESAGVRCLDDRATDELLDSDDGVPQNEAEEQRFLAEQKRFANACAKNSGKLLPHLGTEDVARDMDLMRQVLGDKKLNYFGISYGTELGGVYAHLFPKNVGRAVFDAVVDPSRSTVETAVGQAKGFQLALENYLKDSGKDPKKGTQEIVELLDRMEKSPLPAGGGRELTREQATTGIAAALYNEDSWTFLTQGLKEAENGSGSVLLSLADFYNGRDQQGRYSNQLPANAAIGCVDTSERFTVDDVKKHLPQYEKASPIFGESLAWGLPGCSSWPVKGERTTPEVSAKGAAPIVVIGNTGDPATPVEGAQNMSDTLGKGVGVTLTVSGEGHGTYGVNECATSAVDAYLLEGKVPQDGKTCS